MPLRQKSLRVLRDFRPVRRRRQALAEAYEAAVRPAARLCVPPRLRELVASQGGGARVLESTGGAG
jgi:hypothetical protein